MADRIRYRYLRRESVRKKEFRACNLSSPHNHGSAATNHPRFGTDSDLEASENAYLRVILMRNKYRTVASERSFYVVRQGWKALWQ